MQAGFISPSIAIPSTISDRLALALRIITFLAANPTYEAPTLGVTPADGTTLRDEATSTQSAATAADQDVANKGDARQITVNALTSKMRLLIGILAELLNPDDTRWLDFGLEMPGKLTTPAAPTGVSVAISPASSATDAADPNTVDVLVTCDAAPFATRYRFRMRIAGLLGSNYELMASTTEPMAQIAVPAGATLEFIVQAVNGNRQSVASEAVVFAAPMAALKSAAKPADATTAIEQITAAAAPASDGQANGKRLPALS